LDREERKKRRLKWREGRPRYIENLGDLCTGHFGRLPKAPRQERE
jgi:hypothetical protein